MLLAALSALLFSFQTPPVPVGEPEIVDRWKISDEMVNESSGLAASRRYSGIYYTHNDSGDSARFFRFNKKGEVSGVFLLDGVKAIDWEDMELTTISGKNYIYLADCGDNDRKREEIFVHRVSEPDAETGNSLLKPTTYRFKYPDRKNDCEAILVNPENGSIWFVSKARDQKTTVYVCREPKAGGVQTLEKVHEDLGVKSGGLGGNLVVAGSVSADGKSVVLKTYAGGYIYRVKEGFDSWVQGTPIPTQFPLEVQGEAVCFSADGAFLISSSEGSPCPIQVFRVPKG